MFGTPTTNLHSPTAIGDVAPNTIAGTTLSSLFTASGFAAPNLVFDYDSTHRGRMWTDSGGVVNIDAPDTGKLFFSQAGTLYFKFDSGFVLQGAGQGYAGASANTAGYAKFSVNSSFGLSGIGLSDAGNGATGLGFCILGTDYVVITVNLVKITSGAAFQLGNSATTGLTAGVLSALTNASVVIKDSTGQSYRVPCII